MLMKFGRPMIIPNHPVIPTGRQSFKFTCYRWRRENEVEFDFVDDYIYLIKCCLIFPVGMTG